MIVYSCLISGHEHGTLELASQCIAAQRALSTLLEFIRFVDQPAPGITVNYELRNDLVLNALGAARGAGLQAGIRIDPVEPTWPVVYIELPTGQISWHLPQHALPWDGHTTDEKYRRAAAFVAQCPPVSLHETQPAGADKEPA